MNITATASYSAVPSMFMVAPRGRTNLPTFLSTPALSITPFIVSGRVAEEEAVENAVSSALLRSVRYFMGFFLAISIKIKGSTMNP